MNDIDDTQAMHSPPPPSGGSRGLLWTWLAIAGLAVGLAVQYRYGARARQELEVKLTDSDRRAQELAAQLQGAETQLADLSTQLEQTRQTIGLTKEELARAAETIRSETRQSDAALAAQLGQLKETSEDISSDVTGAKTEIAATKQDLEATKIKLERTIGDLGVQTGLIARTREELEELVRRGERSIAEFDLGKTKQPVKVGPVRVQLKKTDTKKNKYTIEVYADDRRIEKKDKTVFEPVQFYVHGSKVPCEFVVLNVAKDRINGYISSPKDLVLR